MKVKIDGKEYKIDISKGATVLDACAQVGINITNLCYSKNLGILSSCRVCVVEIVGRWNLIPACGINVEEGMEIKTNTARVIQARKTVLELLLSDHQLDCLSCARTADCRLKKAAEDSMCDANRFIKTEIENRTPDNDRYITRNQKKCILCARCVKVCMAHQEVGVLAINGRGIQSRAGVAWDKELGSVPCIACGQCVVNCPTAALEEKGDLPLLKRKLADQDTHVVVALAPSTRVALGESFGMEPGTNVEGKMISALRKLGFDRVFDLNLAADFTIMEEGTELINRIKENKNLPQYTSCCPAWINYVTMTHKDLIPNISTTKSPQQIFGALAKSYYAEKAKIDPKKMHVVMMMPCVAKAGETERAGIDSVDPKAKIKDVDQSITVKQFARLMKEYKIDFAKLEEEKFDDPLGLSSGAGLIFGTTGGVCEAALRTIVETQYGTTPQAAKRAVDFHNVRGEQGLKEAIIDELKDANGNPVKVAVVSGISNAEALIQKIKKGKAFYHFIEVMACPGGCVNGGGMPVHDANLQDNFANARKRASTIYDMDQYNNLRRSHENPTVKQIYKEFLGEPNGDLAHKLLHSTHKPKKRYN